MKRLLIVGGGLAAALFVAWLATFNTRHPVHISPNESISPVATPESKPNIRTSSAPPNSASRLLVQNPPNATPVQPVEPAPRRTTNAIQKASANTKPAKAPKPPLKDPLARVALSLVGFDPAAEEYWLMAINDPAITGEEKEDLIEDLNEEGFADPKNLTAADIPLIAARIEIIETYAPLAIDDANARAFAEAYNDLWNMLAKASGR